MCRVRHLLMPLLLLLGACDLSPETPPLLVSRVQSFGAAPLGPGERVLVVAGLPPEAQGLESQSWVREAEAQMLLRGLQLAASPAEATLFAAISLWMDEGREVAETRSVPVIGVTGTAFSQTTGQAQSFGGMTSLQTQTTSLPSYGVIGQRDRTITTTRFRRGGLLLLARPTPSGPPRPIFEARLASEGPCGMLGLLAPGLVGALFHHFPQGGSGLVETPFPQRC